jgi:GntR family transcriptional repressor for pyruvate dehydrogenase complex
MKNKLKLKPLNKKKLYEEIALQIENLIENGELKAGNRIPAERELANIFNVSRNPVREAIRVLEEKQLLQSRPGDGTYVILKEKDSLIAGLASTIQSEKIKLYEIFEFRRTIEPQICYLAAKNAKQEDVQTLKNILKSQKLQIEKGKSGIEADKKFHIALAKASRNSIFLKSIYILNNILDESRSEFLQTTERRKVSLESHEAILLAVEQHKPKLAWDLMVDHIIEIEKVSSK